MSTDGYAPGPVPRRGMARASPILGIVSVVSFGSSVALVGDAGTDAAGVLFYYVFCVSAVAGFVLGILALVRAVRAPHLYGGKGMAVAALTLPIVSVFVIGMMGEVQRRQRSHDPRRRNESATIGDIRTFISAEAGYQSASGGYFGPPECLSAPATCIPGYPGNAPTFLDSQLASMVPKSGYRRTFHPGPLVSAPTNAAGDPVPSGSFERFAYTAVPVEPGVTGRWSFCGDLSTTSGRLCEVRSGSGPIDASGGQCPPPPACAEYEPGR